MKRVAVCIVILLMFSIVALTGVDPASSQGGPPPTNTRRPTAIMTNTRRVPPSPSLVPTDTLPPTSTHTPTSTPSPTLTYTFTPSLTPTTIGPQAYPENYNPLTGLPYPSEEAKNRRNLIVKVSNFPYIVRPQSGLDKADLVYEYEVEGGVTRFAAIYRSQGSEHVGSVRSGRLLDLELVVMYQALFAYSGTNDNIKKMIGEADWKYWTLTPQFGDNCPPFCRFPRPGLPFEHTLFGNTYQMWDLATRRNVNTGYQARGFAFNERPAPGGKPINDIYIKWYGDQDARWLYNPADGKYYRWNTGLPHIDALTGQQLTADNVVVIQAYHVDRPDIYESESGAVTIEIQLWGREKAWVFRDGVWYQGQWIRSRQGARGGLQLVYPDGTPIQLKPGNTWIEVVRCCNMFGVTLSDSYVDVLGTATPAAATHTARAPKVPAEALTKQAPAANATGTASAATAQFSSGGQSPGVPLAAPGTPTGTAPAVGMLVR